LGLYDSKLYFGQRIFLANVLVVLKIKKAQAIFHLFTDKAQP
jgi:hypothetical protein